MGRGRELPEESKPEDEQSERRLPPLHRGGPSQLLPGERQERSLGIGQATQGGREGRDDSELLFLSIAFPCFNI